MSLSWKKITQAALFGLVCLAGGVSSASADTAIVDPDAKEFRVGWAVWFPYMFVDPATQKMSGITVDIFEALASELDKEVVFIEDSWATIVAGLQAGRYDVTMPLAQTPARIEAAAFTSNVMNIMYGLAVLKDNEDRYGDWRDLDKPGVTVTTTLGASVHTAVEKKLTGGAELILVKSSSESIAQLLTGRADAWANTYDAFIHVTKEHPSIVKVPGDPIGVEGLAFAVAKGNDETIRQINDYMKKIKESGQLVEILEKYGLDESFLAD